MIQSVAVPLIDDFAMFEFGVVCEVFGLDRSYAGLEPFDFRVCTIHPDVAVTSPVGVTVTAPYGLEAMDDADLIAIPAATVRDEYPEEFLDALRRAYDRGAILLSVCSGAFALGAAGLLDGRDCTTHWRFSAELQRRFPEARVDPDVLFVDDGRIITSAGTSAGITFSELLDHLTDRLDEAHTVSSLADRVHMSTRSFSRRFVAETGVSPMQWLTTQRILHARLLLETTDLSIDEVARQCGFSSATLLRHHFDAEVGVPPTRYRAAFARA